MSEQERGNVGGAPCEPSGELGRAVASLRAAHPPDGVTARLVARLGPGLGGPPEPGDSGGSQGSLGQSPSGALTTAPLQGAVVKSAATAKGVLVAMMVGAVGFGTLGLWKLTRQSNPAPSPSAVVLAAPQASESVSSSAAAVDSAPTQSPTLSSPEVLQDSAAGDNASRPSSAAPSEAQLLTNAKRLVATEPAAAVRLLQQHARLYPNGMLGQERDVLLIDAKARLGEVEEARRSARDFLKNHPESAYETKIRQSTSEDASADHNSGR